MSVQPKIDPFGRKEVTVLSSLHKFKYMYSMYDLTLTKNWIFEFECVLSLQRTSLNKIKKTILSPGTYCTHNHH